jgi:hypothetical protein
VAQEMVSSGSRGGGAGGGSTGGGGLGSRDEGGDEKKIRHNGVEQVA